MTAASAASLPRAVARLGFGSAIASAVLAFGWFVTMIIQTIVAPPQAWTGIEAFARTFQPVQLLNFVPSLPLASTFLVMMVCVYFYAAEPKRIWALLGVAFTTVYAVMASSNYAIQLLVVRASLAAGETEGLGLLSHANSHSVFWALATSYGYMSLAMLCAAWVFGADRIGRWIRWLFVAVGVTAPLQFVGVLFELGVAAGALPGLVWSLATPAACLLLAVVFRRADAVRA